MISWPDNSPQSSQLDELLAGLGCIEPIPSLKVTGITLDSKKTVAGSLFIAINGSVHHGLNFASEAVSRDAVAIAYDPAGTTDDILDFERKACVLLAIPRLGKKLELVAGRFYKHPSRDLAVIGITGTNGKTSSSHLLAQALSKSHSCGVIGTLGWGFPDQLKALQNTTPDSLVINGILASFRSRNTEFVAMEVSSHGLDQGRTRGIVFKGAAFTNITRDHLDYHKTMRVYIGAKLKLLEAPGLEFVVINLDDKHADQVLSAVPPNVRILGFSRGDDNKSPFARLKFSTLRHDEKGVALQVQFENKSVLVSAPVFCDFNVENLMTALGVMLELGIPLTKAVEVLETVKPVSGRLERFSVEGSTPTIIVDYAHTPHALQSILDGLRIHCSGSLWLVFGCGGDRDRGKRPIMGRIAETKSDFVFITDDNPRTEDGDAIVRDILRGCQDPGITVMRDRNKAIRTAIERAGVNDLVVIAGKGHENTQEINGKKYPFDDRLIVGSAVAQRAELAGISIQ